ncbi:adenosylcobinamide-GDP ribazoletransferase [Marimonas arenosa]|uniref:Adenosylcobinamide-GDP ribazoletransferase n=1 Tax=Marimonas arenosa TaxID=1795305 RepID=A0AAE3WG36_9RHOB|nr:adenosylcobinamide-GDP ribazoletransferase [Marimonas arenosa]MDQ2091097.1 adenosylcobinamide-GDP ribazoletransferase [Marimonas arenosa]
MHESDRLFRPDDFPAALALLSRWPLRIPERALARGARTAWSWPLVGLALAGLAALTAWIAQILGIPEEISALLALTTLVVLTGALHEDGLADTADGFWGGFETTRRLEIMRDSRIGSYGVLALVLSLLLRGAGLIALSDHLFAALVVPAATSRAAMAYVMDTLPGVRPDGLSHTTGLPGADALRAALLIAAVIALLFAGWAGIWAIVAAAAACVLVANLALAKVGGQTGDVLGATQQITEIAALLALTATL